MLLVRYNHSRMYGDDESCKIHVYSRLHPPPRTTAAAVSTKVTVVVVCSLFVVAPLCIGFAFLCHCCSIYFFIHVHAQKLARISYLTSCLHSTNVLRS